MQVFSDVVSASCQYLSYTQRLTGAAWHGSRAGDRGNPEIQQPIVLEEWPPVHIERPRDAEGAPIKVTTCQLLIAMLVAANHVPRDLDILDSEQKTTSPYVQ